MLPATFEVGMKPVLSTFSSDDPQAYYHEQQYFAVIDVISGQLSSQFSQAVMKQLEFIETILLHRPTCFSIPRIPCGAVYTFWSPIRPFHRCRSRIMDGYVLLLHICLQVSTDTFARMGPYRSVSFMNSFLR